MRKSPGVGAVLLCLATALPATAATSPAAAGLTIRGRGDGHGVGLPQDGALALGKAGKSAAEILSTFYPGTTLSTRPSVDMHVAVWESDPQVSVNATAAARLRRDAAPGSNSHTEIVLPSGGQVTGASGTLSVRPGGRVTLSQAGGSWTASLTPVKGASGGRSVPRLFADSDDDVPTPTPTDTPTTAVPSDSASAPSTPDTGTGDPATSAPPVEPTASSAPSVAGPTVGPEPEPARSAATPASHPTPAVATAATGSPSATPSSSVEASELVISPDGADGVTDLLDTGRSYHGQIVTGPGELVDDVPLESYLRGLGEVLDPKWPAAGLQALVIAARTYALRDAYSNSGADDPQHVNICATDACQVYLGAGVEYPQLDAAVAATSDTIVTYDGEPAATYYSASAGGATATPAEGFGASSTALPYLRSVSYDDGGNDGWQRTVSLATAATALGYPGALTRVEVTARGPSGRATALVLHGSTGDVQTTGLAFAAALQLPSTLLETGSGVAAPAVDQSAAPSILPALTAEAAGAPSVVAVPAPIVAPEAPLSGPAAAAPQAAGLPALYARLLGAAPPSDTAWSLPPLEARQAAGAGWSPWWIELAAAVGGLLALLVVSRRRAGAGQAGRHRG